MSDRSRAEFSDIVFAQFISLRLEVYDTVKPGIYRNLCGICNQGSGNADIFLLLSVYFQNVGIAVTGAFNIDNFYCKTFFVKLIGHQAKYVTMLEEKHLIRTEHTEVIRKDGMKYNGTLRYTISPFREAEDYYHQKQLERLNRDTEKRRVQTELERCGAAFIPAGGTA